MHETPVEPSEPMPPRRKPRPRVKRSFGWRVAQTFRVWARETFAREQLIASLKSLAWVAPMTVLIWVYAEREQAGKMTVEIRVQAHNADPVNRLVEVVTDSEGHIGSEVVVRADLLGPQARLEQVRAKLQEEPLKQEVDRNLEAGAHTIDLTDPGNADLFVKSGVTISNLSPAKMKVIIDPIIRRSIPVTVHPGATNLEGTPVFKPEAVQVSVPKSVIDAPGTKLAAYADLPELTEPGPRTLPVVPVSLSLTGPHVEFTPATVSADVVVKKSDLEDSFRSVPVWVLYPPSPTWDKYKVEYDKNLDDVKVTGPAEIIAKINDPDFEPKPKAVFDITTMQPPIEANPAGTHHTANLTFDFGATGLKISGNDPHKTINFTIVERKTGE